MASQRGVASRCTGLAVAMAATVALGLGGSAQGSPGPRSAQTAAVAGNAAVGTAPGGPGQALTWTPADKSGFGTATSRSSTVWFTLQGGEMSEVYYPRIDTPSYRDLQFAVSDGHSFAERATDATRRQATLADPRSLTYQLVDTDARHRWRLTETYVTDPRRATVVVTVRFQSLTGRPYHLYLLAHPALSNGRPESGSCSTAGLVARDRQMSSAVLTQPALERTSCGYDGRSDGWTDLREHGRMAWSYASAPNGNVVQTGQTALTGTPGHQRLTLALGFGSDPGAAVATARASLRTGWRPLANRYASGWHTYLRSLHRPPRSLATYAERIEYTVSEMVLAASEDKTHRGAYVASPSMPWAWGTGLQTPTGPYHLVWSRDLYEIATALIADGDVNGARRALHFLFDRQQERNGSFPQNSDVTGRPVLTNLQLDEVADPIILADQLGDDGPATWRHVQSAANFIAGWHDKHGHAAPYTPEERWENQAGYSPATIAAEIAGLVCAAHIAQENGDSASAARYLATADDWRAKLTAWTLTTTGPYGLAYYLRLSKNGNPNSGVKYAIGDSGPSLDQRTVVDPSFLELVRLGIEPADDPNILSTLRVVDAQLSVNSPEGVFWHRYTDDGYGEQRNGQPWNVGFPDSSQATIGRAWPIFTGERGEYDVAAGTSAAPELETMAAAANRSGFLPEQVWDANPPSGHPGFVAGRPTTSATPLEWTHAQFIRLAWSIAAGNLVEQPAVVACRYVRRCG